MEQNHMCHCRCGLCKLNLGKKVNIPYNLQSMATIFGFDSQQNNCYLLNKNSINTSQESNLKVLKRGDGLYVVMCRICKEAFLLHFSTKFGQDAIFCLALIPKSWLHPISPGGNPKQQLASKQQILPAKSMQDLFKFDGVENSPVIIRPQTIQQLTPVQPLEDYDDKVEDQIEIVHDCIIGSFYESPLYMDQLLFA